MSSACSKSHGGEGTRNTVVQYTRDFSEFSLVVYFNIMKEVGQDKAKKVKDSLGGNLSSAYGL